VFIRMPTTTIQTFYSVLVLHTVKVLRYDITIIWYYGATCLECRLRVLYELKLIPDIMQFIDE
jgi:hypothetical protein